MSDVGTGLPYQYLKLQMTRPDILDCQVWLVNWGSGGGCTAMRPSRQVKHTKHNESCLRAQGLDVASRVGRIDGTTVNDHRVVTVLTDKRSVSSRSQTAASKHPHERFVQGWKRIDPQEPSMQACKHVSTSCKPQSTSACMQLCLPSKVREG